MQPVAIAYALFIPFWLYCWYRCIRFMRGTVKEFAPSSFNFYVTDIWAGVVALLPSYLLVKELVNSRTQGGVFDMAMEIVFGHAAGLTHTLRINVIDVSILAVSQICGMVVGRLSSIKRAGENIPRRLDQAAWILAGGLLIGPLMLLGIVILFGFLALAGSTAFACPPCFLASVGTMVCLYFRRRLKG